jgi:hypothetical protein
LPRKTHHQHAHLVASKRTGVPFQHWNSLEKGQQMRTSLDKMYALATRVLYNSPGSCIDSTSTSIVTIIRSRLFYDKTSRSPEIRSQQDITPHNFIVGIKTVSCHSPGLLNGDCKWIMTASLYHQSTDYLVA